MPGSEILPVQAAELLTDLTAIIARASALIRAASPATVVQRIKPDQSPVTAADEASEAVILQGLARLLPNVPVISEEMAGKTARRRLDRSFIVVDPLDGTREFLAGRDEFTVNLAIVTGGVPIAGIIAAPTRGLLWRGVVGGKAERLRLLADGADQAQPIRTRRWPEQDAVAAVSRSHFDPETDAFPGPGCPRSRAAPAVRRSSSARSRKARPMSIRASPPPANGMWRPDMRWCLRPVES